MYQLMVQKCDIIYELAIHIWNDVEMMYVRSKCMDAMLHKW